MHSRGMRVLRTLSGIQGLRAWRIAFTVIACRDLPVQTPACQPQLALRGLFVEHPIEVFASPAARMQKMTSQPESPSSHDLPGPAWTSRLMPGVSVVVPVYNSAATLPILVQRLEPALVALRIPFAVILVNDGSTDTSWQVIEELAQKHRWVEGVCMMRNYGQHNALLAGLREARHETVVTMDDDLQHPPEEIHKLLAELNRGL